MLDVDDRSIQEDSHTLIHRILKLIRECESLGIDYEDYIDRNRLLEIISVLDCCIDNKDILGKW